MNFNNIININGENIKFSVKGYGHGVGMSQTGADTMAKNGSTAEDIIKHFYMNVEILKNCYLKEDGKLDREESKLFSGKVAGVCYAKEGYRKLENEDVEKTKRRISMTMDNGHHSVYDHVTITLNLENIPKILAMVLNNEH